VNRAFDMRHRRGFALVSALFLIVVLSALGAFLVNLVAVQHATPAMRAQSARADYAARSGMAWAVSRAINAGACPASETFSLSGGALNGFSVTARCSRSNHDLGGTLVPYYVIDVSAQSGSFGSADFVARTLQAKVGGA
jgi:MSHA biogenesis protein MshP